MNSVVLHCRCKWKFACKMMRLAILFLSREFEFDRAKNIMQNQFIRAYANRFAVEFVLSPCMSRIRKFKTVSRLTRKQDECYYLSSIRSECTLERSSFGIDFAFTASSVIKANWSCWWNHRLNASARNRSLMSSRVATRDRQIETVRCHVDQ